MWLNLFIAAALILGLPAYAQDKPDPSRAITALEPMVSTNNLALMTMPLTQGELKDEIAAWQERVQQAVTKLNGLQIQLNRISAIEMAREAGEDPPTSALLGPPVDVADKERFA